MAPAEVRGLKNVVWKKIKLAVFDECKKEDEWKVLLLDHFTTKLLSSCCKMSDLLAEGISVVEDVHKNHEPVPHLKAIYFITPTEKSVDGLIRDFKNKSSYKYKAAYVYFSDFCPDVLFHKIKSSCAKAIKRCKEINISFIPQESQVFTLHIPDVFHSCYSPDVEIESVLDITAQQIVTLCGILDENPGVRYKKQPLDNANALANLVEEKLVHYYKTDEEGKVKGKTQSQLLIVDRGFDPVSTVLHELTFQAMVYDLLPIEKDIYRYQTDDSNKEKEAYLDEHDELWVKIRHKHIAYVLEEIPRLVKEISSSKKATEAKLTMSNLAQLMKKMPHFRKQLSTQTLHLNVAENCMKKFQSHVEKLCKSEQDLALGTDAEGQKVRDFMRVLLPVLFNKSFDPYDKIRAILLYIFGMNGTTQENLDKLIQHAQIISDSDMIENWKYLGVPIISSSASQQRKPARRNRSQEETFQLSRWTPVIKDIMEDAIENKLDPKEWIYCSECPAAWNGSGAVSARQKYKTNMTDERKNETKLIIFILGGMTHSEMRCAYEVSEAYKSCEIIIGSTHILTPKRLLDDVKALSKPKVSQDTFSLIIE